MVCMGFAFREPDVGDWPSGAASRAMTAFALMRIANLRLNLRYVDLASKSLLRSNLLKSNEGNLP